jgi:hypothetical protein
LGDRVAEKLPSSPPPLVAGGGKSAAGRP